MKFYDKSRLSLWCLVLIMAGSAVIIQSESHELGDLDVMTDFGYPISMMQVVRQSVYQAVHALQHQDNNTAISMLQDAHAKLTSRLSPSEDDIHAIQAMLDKINALIETLEAQDRSLIISLCQQVQAQL